MKAQALDATSESGFLGHSLSIGTIAGTKIRLHWTFLAYLAWLGIAFLLSGGAGAALSGVGFILAVFACVVAHEFGHILTARRFGIVSPDVTLLPIGGVARLQAIPERPTQELAVALAGPAVNLVIAAALMLILGPGPRSADLAAIVQPKDILPALATINLFLALFNLLPAFPMDGGRALRALLSIFLERGRATAIAAGVGQALAVALGLFGLLAGHVLLIFIAMFVYFAASAEAQDVQLHRLADRLRTADAMVTELLPLSMSDTLADAAELLLRSEQREFPVLDEQGDFAGILTREGMIRGLNAHGPEAPIGSVMLAQVRTISADTLLSEALPLIEGDARPVVVIDGTGKFAGLLTRETLGELLLLASVRPRGVSEAFPTAGRILRATHDPSASRPNSPWKIPLTRTGRR